VFVLEDNIKETNKNYKSKIEFIVAEGYKNLFKGTLVL